jgi:putative flippase GtrA
VPQPLRFLIVGGVNTVVGYLVFALLVFLVKSDLAVVLMAYVAHVLVSPLAFFLYRTLVFPSTRGIVSSFLRFQAGYALPLLLNGPLLYFGIAVLDGDPLVVQAALTALLIMMAFVANRYFAFSSPRQTTPTANQP